MFVWLAGALATLIGQSAVRFTAWKMVIWVLATSIFPIILNNVMYDLIQKFVAARGSYTGAAPSAQVLQFTGLAGWLAVHFRIPECLSLIMSAIAFKYSVSYFHMIFSRSIPTPGTITTRL